MSIPDALDPWAPVLVVAVALAAGWALQRTVLSVLQSRNGTRALLAAHVRAPIRLVAPLLALEPARPVTVSRSLG